jgi:hypothetical protein
MKLLPWDLGMMESSIPIVTMTLARFLLASGFALAACTNSNEPLPPPLAVPRPTTSEASGSGTAPRILGGSKLHYRDLHSRNTYEFKNDGRFLFDYVHHGSGDSGQREGTYRYQVTAPGKARVDFNDGDLMRMEFDTPLSGICIFDGDVRRYGFTLTRPDGE